MKIRGKGREEVKRRAGGDDSVGGGVCVCVHVCVHMWLYRTAATNLPTLHLPNMHTPTLLLITRLAHCNYLIFTHKHTVCVHRVKSLKIVSETRRFILSHAFRYVDQLQFGPRKLEFSGLGRWWWGLYLIWSDSVEWQEGQERGGSLQNVLYWTCGHMWKVQQSSWRSVVSPAPCEESYLKTATDGSAGIKWHLRTEAFGWMPTRCS